MGYSAAVLADAPLAFWPLTDPLLGTYTSFRDVTGHGYDARLLAGTATAVPAPFGHGTAPDCAFTVPPASSDAIWLDNPPGFPLDGDAYTFEGWCKPILNDSFWMALYSYGPRYDIGSVPFTRAYFLCYEILGDFSYPSVPASDGHVDSDTFGPQNDVDFTRGAGISWPSSYPTLMDGAWHHVAVTDDAAGTVSLYVDGALVNAVGGAGTSNGVVASATNVFSIGDPGAYPPFSTQYPTPAQEPCGSAFSHWAVYTHALSASRIAAHYSAASVAGTSTGYVLGLRLTPQQPSGRMTWDGDGASAPAATTPLVAAARLLYAENASGDRLWSHDGTVFTTYKNGAATATWGA